MEQNHTLLPYQKRVGQFLHQGKNVILQAPTGAGKTYAALRPFLYGLEKGSNFPEKCIYAVPMRVLANQFVEDYQDAISERAMQKHLVNQRQSGRSFVDIQTGEQRRDPTFEAVLTFATIDQVLSSFLIAPYSLPNRQANLNAGATAASYLVFDEFHLLDPSSTLPTTLEMLQMLRGSSPFLLMTATFSRVLLHNLAEWLGAEVVGGTDAELAAFSALPSQQKIRRYHAVDMPLTAAQVWQAHGSRSLVICNRVERAQTLFKAIRKLAPADVEVLLLHSRFLDKERTNVETKIRKKFGKDADPSGSLIVVATQAIEVGLDITSTVLHTELAPANAMVQRAGRCARYEKTEGDVYIYRYAQADDGTAIDLTDNVMPYVNQETVIKLTWEAFAARQGVLDYAAEQEILNHAHRAQDEKLCEALRSGRSEHRSDVFGVMAGQTGQATRLIRDIQQQRVIIHDEPERLLNEVRSPYALKGFGVHIGTLQGYAKEWLLDRVLDEEPPFRVKWLSAQKDEDPEQNNHTVFQWVCATDPKNISGAPIIVVHPALASYDPILGFLPHQATEGVLPDAETSDTAADADFEGYGYRLETYEQHIALVYGQFQDVVWPELAQAAARLERRYRWPSESIWRAARLAVLLHDTGKLNVKWQDYVHEWEKFLGFEAKLRPGEAYAHTDNYTHEHWEKSREFKRKRPPHAVESAVAASYVLGEQLTDLPDLFMAAFTAIARHHAPHSSEFERYRLEPEAVNRTRRIMVRHAPDLSVKTITFPDMLTQRSILPADALIEPTPKQEAAHLAYILLARALRRADQRGTAMGTHKEVAGSN